MSSDKTGSSPPLCDGGGGESIKMSFVIKEDIGFDTFQWVGCTQQDLQVQGNL